jgi:hypothetical protein
VFRVSVDRGFSDVSDVSVAVTTLSFYAQEEMGASPLESSDKTH